MTYRNHRTLMVQGTTSDAGKSVLVTGLCRVLARQGIKVAPFKSQNMALNSAVTSDGGEIGRAQAVQAQACNLPADVRMNPVLLKPNSDLGSQVIVRGQAIGNMKAADYHVYKLQLLKEVIKAHDELRADFDVVLVEGAGSPAEINLREHDLANMGFAEAIDCPVIIVADIDRGGIFAHLYGTYALLSESEQNRVEGFVINRFRGDPALLQGGLDWLQEKTSKPILAVLPYLHNLHIEAEDAVAQQQTQGLQQHLKIVVPVYPRASNHTDFDALRLHPQVDCQLLHDINQYQGADLIILPGSKNTCSDLAWLKQQGWTKVIQRHLRLGGKVMGVCGGYQMLGNWVHDPTGSESSPGSSAGLGLLDIDTTLTGAKYLRNVQGQWAGLQDQDAKVQVTGYEIHVGETTGKDTQRPLFQLQNLDVTSSNDRENLRPDGGRNSDNSVIGTYVHGLFDEVRVLESILTWAGAESLQSFDYQAHRANEIDRLADAVETAMPSELLHRLLAWQEEDKNKGQGKP